MNNARRNLPGSAGSHPQMALGADTLGTLKQPQTPTDSHFNAPGQANSPDAP